LRSELQTQESRQTSQKFRHRGLLELVTLDLVISGVEVGLVELLEASFPTWVCLTFEVVGPIAPLSNEGIECKIYELLSLLTLVTCPVCASLARRVEIGMSTHS
jgi:hypothetical protein